MLTPYAPLPGDRARFVGAPVAMVLAETLAAAKDAAELVEVDYAPLPAVTLGNKVVPPAPLCLLIAA